MRRLLLLTALFAVSLHAGTVYVTAHGKTFHTDKTCMSLAKSHNILTTDDKTAEAHGLRECAICAHRHAAGTTTKNKKTSNESWAK
jgi:hypothetical protein